MEGPAKVDYTVQMAKDRVDQCKTKYLLYGGAPDKPETPHKNGKRVTPIAEKAYQRPSPYSTDDALAPPRYESPKRSPGAVATRKEGQEKVGSGNFDPSVYAANIAANQVTKERSRAKNWNSGGVFPQ